MLTWSNFGGERELIKHQPAPRLEQTRPDTLTYESCHTMNFYISFSLLIKNSYLASDKQKRVPTNATANLPLCAKNKAGLRRIRFAGHMRLSARRVEWSSAGLCRYCLDREGGRPVDQFDQYSNLSENTSHSTWGRHTHTHAHTDVGYRHI